MSTKYNQSEPKGCFINLILTVIIIIICSLFFMCVYWYKSILSSEQLVKETYGNNYEQQILRKYEYTVLNDFSYINKTQIKVPITLSKELIRREYEK